jgi:hypothetical protein
MTDEVLVTPAVDIQVVFGSDGQRGFTVRFAPLPLDMGRKELDAALDLVLAAVARQQAKYEVEDEEARLAEQKDRLRTYEGSMETMEETAKAQWESEGRKGEWTPERLSPAQRNARDSLHMALTKERHEAKARQEKLARLKGKINGSDSSADRNFGDANSPRAGHGFAGGAAS